jgi:uncharacterized protein DUF6941
MIANRPAAARIEWALLCDRAFLDRHERVSVIGVTTHFPVSSLPLVIHKIMMVAKLVDVRPGDRVEVGVAMSTPRGEWTQPMPAAFDVEQAGEYLFVTLHEVPLAEAGTHRFALGLGQQEVVVEVPVTVVSRHTGVCVH